MKTIWEVRIRWADNDDEQGTYTGQAEGCTREEAIDIVAREMAETRDGCGPDASETRIQTFIEHARERVDQAWSVTEHVFDDLKMVLEDDLQGRRLDPAALVDLIRENLDRVAPVVEPRRAA
ncbi:hypothetical protein A8H39_01950 [Paraburkholderia fungorum]|uniref:hypothetical protein n=1 Tax=Paraburkholderia fungorum TaxID=134537 RepID=UPI000488B9DC|nr:hypothetical protein [Paraburkholderia fungorum]MBB5546588.1 hypothetical protein [Paraburkholderia fungorum]PNE59935.1 hypothetical protein A8H39_01950 [Paraburkholderia fungorum]